MSYSLDEIMSQVHKKKKILQDLAPDLWSFEGQYCVMIGV